MSYERMLKAEVELKDQIKSLLDKAKAADEAEKNEPELDIPAEIARRQDRLAQITAAKARLEQRQREADLQCGRDQDNDRKPRDKNDKVKPGGNFKRDFGVPKDTAQENFTDADSRVMKRSGGGFDYSYNAQTAVDETAHIIVAAELTNMAADSGELPGVLQAVKANLDAEAKQALADAGYRNEAAFEQLGQCSTELVVALWREGKEQAAIDSQKYPHTAAMATKLQTDETKNEHHAWQLRANGKEQSALPVSQSSLQQGQAQRQNRKNRSLRSRIASKMRNPGFCAATNVLPRRLLAGSESELPFRSITNGCSDRPRGLARAAPPDPSPAQFAPSTPLPSVMAACLYRIFSPSDMRGFPIVVWIVVLATQ